MEKIIDQIDQEAINAILDTNDVKDIVNSEVFYFLYGKEALENWLALELSENVQNELLKLSADYQNLFLSIAEEQEEMFSIKNLLLEIVAYCDSNAKDKNSINRYSDKRTLAKAGVYMGDWISKLVQYKVEGNIEDGSVKNAINYLLNPEENCTILSNEHRKQVSTNFLKSEYRPNKFNDDLETFFLDSEVECKNQLNLTHLYTRIIYHFKPVWIEEILGLMATDGTGWQEPLINELKVGQYAVLWNSKRPTGTSSTTKLLKERFKEGQSINLYYSIHGKIEYVAEIIDIAENDTELAIKNWPSLNGEIHWYNKEFKDYKDGNKHARILFLAKRIYKIKPLAQKKFGIFKNYQYPTQDNLTPLKSVPSLDSHEEILTSTSKYILDDLAMKFPLNQILYGPPGTGKTYHTLNRTIAIIEGKSLDGIAKEPRFDVKSRFNAYAKEGRVGVLTFHQSISYEDFIEGIKPEIEEDEAGTRSVIYNLHDGVFKQLSIKASYELLNANEPKAAELKTEALTFDDNWGKLVNNFEKQIDANKEIQLSTKNGKIYAVEVNDNGNIVLKHSTKSDKTYLVSYNRIKKLYHALPERQKLEQVSNLNKTIRNIIGGCNASAYYAVLMKLYEQRIETNPKEKLEESLDYEEQKSLVEKSGYQFLHTLNKAELKPGKPFVLIIDEINRGNVSQIFGELITLIEDDKRMGNKEALEVTLPYSKQLYSIPNNLYIIGTMNTADRSVEALDTALRRRFSFVEMLPNPDLISPERMVWDLWWKYELTDNWEDEPWLTEERDLYKLLGAGLLLKMSPEEKERIWNEMYDNGAGSEVFAKVFSEKSLNFQFTLEKINKRLEKLLSRDHTIGHSFFLGISTEIELYNSFYNKIIPLLQEYFFGDYGKIGLVLGEEFIEDISKVESEENFFARFEYDDKDLLFEKRVYRINKFMKDGAVDYASFLDAVKSI